MGHDVLLHSFFGIFKTLGHIVDGLIFGDWVFLFSRFAGLEFAQFWLTRQTILKLTVRGKQTSSISLQFAVLSANTEFNSEPKTL